MRKWLTPRSGGPKLRTEVWIIVETQEPVQPVGKTRSQRSKNFTPIFRIGLISRQWSWVLDIKNYVIFIKDLISFVTIYKRSLFYLCLYSFDSEFLQFNYWFCRNWTRSTRLSSMFREKCRDETEGPPFKEEVFLNIVSVTFPLWPKSNEKKEW